MLKEIKTELRKKSDKEKAKILQKFFKTAKGQYGEGDILLGITVPEQRKIAKIFFEKTNLNDIQNLLNSKFHEERLTALLILIERYKKNLDEKNLIIEFYLKNIKNQNVNSWDLVDLSSYNLLGDFLINKNKKILYELTKGNLWEKRTAVVSCFSFIRQNDFEDILNISDLMLSEKHDLIQKAVGWMLREVGKRNEKVLIDFLEKNYNKMPRTMLRYSIEKFAQETRKKYLAKN